MEGEKKVFATFAGIIYKIQTLKGGDGAYRITIDIPLTCKDAVKSLMDVENEVCGFAVAKEDNQE